jgi:hypothetical protein
MKGYMQTYDESGNHSLPFPDEYQEFQSLEHAHAIFGAWVDEVSRYTDESNASAWLWFGEPTGQYPCDTYPDRVLSVGPRGGIKEETA